MATTKKKQSNAIGDWDKVYIFGGEPWQCQTAVDAAISSSGAKRVLRYTSDDPVGDIQSSLSKMQWMSESEVVVLTNPTTEQMKICYSDVFIQIPFVFRLCIFWF